MPHVRSIDAPPVTSERTTGGKGSSLEGRPAHIARSTMSANGKQERGREKARVSTTIFLVDTPVLLALLPLGACLLSLIVGGDVRILFLRAVGSGLMLVRRAGTLSGCRLKPRLCMFVYFAECQ